MTEDDKEKGSGPSGPGEEEADSAAESSRKDEEQKTGAGTETSPSSPKAAASPPLSEGKEPEVEISAALRQALAEAEASLAQKEKEAKKEVAVSGELIAPAEIISEANSFDPNQVDEIAEPPPPPPSKKELELKMQILDLRAQLRQKEAELEQKIKEIKQNAEQARLLQRNFDAYKARVQREKADVFNYGHEPLLRELLPIVDNFERALAHAADNHATASIREGVEMILQQFRHVLAKFGVTPIETEGQTFNPEFHQAIAQVEHAELPSNSILEVHQRGYMLKDRLLRPAMVVVSKRPVEKKETETGSAVEEKPGEEASQNDSTEG